MSPVATKMSIDHSPHSRTFAKGLPRNFLQIKFSSVLRAMGSSRCSTEQNLKQRDWKLIPKTPKDI